MSNVTETPDKGEPTPYAATAAELRRVADALDTIQGATVPPFVTLSILPKKGETAEETIAAVDAVTLAVFGKVAVTERNGSAWYRIARESRNDEHLRMSLAVHAEVPGPPDERDSELEKLRAEVAELRSGLGYSREADDPTPVSPARAPLHVIEPLSQIAEDGHRLDTQTRPQCSPECLRAYALKEVFATQHIPSCPVGHAEAQGGGQ